MKRVPKYIFAEKAEVSPRTLGSWLKDNESDLLKLGQRKEHKQLNYKAVIYLCLLQAIDVKEVYPDVTKEEISETYIQINTLLDGKISRYII